MIINCKTIILSHHTGFFSAFSSCNARVPDLVQSVLKALRTVRLKRTVRFPKYRRNGMAQDMAMFHVIQDESFTTFPRYRAIARLLLKSS